MMSAQSWLSTRPLWKSFSISIKTITIASLSSQSRIARSGGSRSEAWHLRRNSTCEPPNSFLGFGMKFVHATNVMAQSIIQSSFGCLASQIYLPLVLKEPMMCAFWSLSTAARRAIDETLLIQVGLCPNIILASTLLIEFTALLRSREVVEQALNGPIAAIDTRDDVLESIRDTRLSDPDSWRTVIQNAPPSERKYLSQVHELLCDLANESHTGGDSTESYTNAFIYNYRTGSCLYYDLGRAADR